MDLTWHHYTVKTTDQVGITTEQEVDFGVDDTGRIFGEIRNSDPVYLALHLNKVVGRYLNSDLAKVAIQKVNDIVTTPNA